MQPIKTVTTLRDQTPATVEILGIEHLAQVLALQDDTRAALPDTQKMFIQPQSSDYFRGLLSRETGVMLGVRLRGQLVAQIALLGPMKLGDAERDHTITRNDVTFHHAGESETVVVVKGMTVHPAWLGNDLANVMLETALGLPITRTADHVFAQVSTDNVRSWELFLRHGFGVVAADMDLLDGKARFVLQKPALGFALHDMAATYDMDYAADFAAIIRLTQREGLIGRMDDGVAFKLAFFASLDHAASWTDTSVVGVNIA